MFAAVDNNATNIQQNPTIQGNRSSILPQNILFWACGTFLERKEVILEGSVVKMYVKWRQK
jgi:hypothetical protein